jgi:hypothetical protein
LRRFYLENDPDEKVFYKKLERQLHKFRKKPSVEEWLQVLEDAYYFGSHRK